MLEGQGTLRLELRSPRPEPGHVHKESKATDAKLDERITCSRSAGKCAPSQHCRPPECHKERPLDQTGCGTAAVSWDRGLHCT